MYNPNPYRRRALTDKWMMVIAPLTTVAAVVIALSVALLLGWIGP